jgi:hypothetical protein
MDHRTAPSTISIHFGLKDPNDQMDFRVRAKRLRSARSFFDFLPVLALCPDATPSLIAGARQVKQNERLTLAHVSVTLAELLGRLHMTGPARGRIGRLTDPRRLNAVTIVHILPLQTVRPFKHQIRALYERELRHHGEGQHRHKCQFRRVAVPDSLPMTLVREGKIGRDCALVREDREAA